MNVQMLGPEYSLTPSLYEHLQQTLRAAFARARSHVVRIVVRLGDLNGPGGGRDKVCQLNVTMAGQPEVVIREVQEDMYYAIDCAVRRAAHRAMRLMQRRHASPAKGEDTAPV
ncbi:HPF/RaiA family ribosome-associated protein [Herbaspirillum sp. ST 5-3]|uniref:HPF/RaiA family ribosome-associated protein n=1 Tax=Oxalobacteraceae TaxID=75682 RepID=UPI0010A2AA72|nr:HPF/RaiA family ribosome-associated protein [Herbaspirillum sp. ST 5-3]